MATATLIDFPKTSEVLERYGQEFIELYKLNLANSGRSASGGLVDSLRYNVVLNDTTFAVDISLRDYWKYIEDGTRPHWPPLSAIRQWIDVKPVIPRPFSNGKLPSPDQLAFLISRKIATVGTEGSHDFERANNELFDRMQMSIAEAVTEDLNAQVEYIFTEFAHR